MMIFFRRFVFLILIVEALPAAETSSCRTWKLGVTECNPYGTTFLKLKNNGRRTLERNSPVTKRERPITEKIKLKSGISLDKLINKYIKREERLHDKNEKKKSEKSEKDLKVSVEKPEISKKTESPKTTQKEEMHAKKETEISEQDTEEYVRRPNPTLTVIKERVISKKALDFEKTIVPTPYIKPEKDAQERSGDEGGDDNHSTLPEEMILPAELIADKNETTVPEQPKKVQEYAIYKVRKGDTLIAIAIRFGIKLENLKRINHLKKKNMLRVGQKLKIPLSQEDFYAIDNATYIVKEGDTLSSIAEHFSVKVSDIKKYNHIRKKSIIHVSQVLMLPLPYKLVELKRIEEKKRQARLRKKRERERLARIALKKRERARFLKLSRGMKHKLSVTATAYTSHVGQTDSTPFLAAWNNRIRPGMKIIAVSPDLIRRYGLTNGKKVRIGGLSGIYTVRDKMNKRWRKRIDIYMGTSRWRALRWGRRRVTLYY